jgi:hypothetical protein
MNAPFYAHHLLTLCCVDVVQMAVLQQQVWDGNMAANEHRKELEAQTLKVRYPTTRLHASL